MVSKARSAVNDSDSDKLNETFDQDETIADIWKDANFNPFPWYIKAMGAQLNPSYDGSDYNHGELGEVVK